MRWLLLPVLSLAACSQGPEADLPAIGEARSLAGEWALVNELAVKGQLTASYTGTMRKAVREQLETARSSLTQPQSAYGEEIAALLREPDDTPSATLRAHSDKLKQIEDSLESA